MEDDFRPLLLSCLRACAAGRWGLFGQTDSPEVSRYYQWDEASQLKEMALEIRALRAEFGQPNPEADRFLHYRSLRGPHVLSEPRLAAAFLDELLKDATPGG